MKPGPNPRQQSAQHGSGAAPQGPTLGDHPLFLSEEQFMVISVLQAAEQALTARQVQSRLSREGYGTDGTLEDILEALVQRRMVARLNTLVPSYTYRYGGVELDIE